MTKRNTYIITAIVVACVVAGVVVYANWDNLRTALTGVPSGPLAITKTPANQEVKLGDIAWFKFTNAVKGESGGPTNGAVHDFLFVDGYGWSGASSEVDEYIDKLWFDGNDNGNHDDKQSGTAEQASGCTGVSGLWGVCALDYDSIYNGSGPDDGYLDSILAYNSEVQPGTGTFYVGIQFKTDAKAQQALIGKTFKNIVGVTAWELNKNKYPTEEAWHAVLNFADLNEFQKWATFNWVRSEANVTILPPSGPVVPPAVTTTVTPPGTPQATLGKTVTPAQVLPGGSVTYTLTVKNTSTVNISNLQVTDDYREDLLENIVAPGGSGMEKGVINWTISLNSGETKTLTYTASVKSSVLGGTRVDNDATCAPTSGVFPLPCEAVASFDVTTGPMPPPEISVVPTPTPVEPAGPHATLEKTVAKVLGGVSGTSGGVSGTGGVTGTGGVSGTSGVTGTGGVETTTMTAAPGDKVQYTISLTNDGNQELHDMKVYDKYPANYLENVTITRGNACSPGVLDQVCFQVGDFPRGTLATTLEYTATVKSNVPNNTEVINDAFCRYEGQTSVSGCQDSVMFKVAQSVEPSANYELWVTSDINLSQANKGERLNYTTKAGNRGTGSASTIWLIDSLLFAHNGEVQLPQLQQAAGQLSDTSTIDDVRTILEQNLGIEETGGLSATGGVSQSGTGVSGTGGVSQSGTGVSGTGGVSQSGNGVSATGGLSQTGTTVESNRVVKPDGTVVYYKNMPGDDATTGLKVGSLSEAGGLSSTVTILDLDRDGIKDTIIHQKDQTWAGTSAGPATVHTVRPYTSVREDLAAGEYRIVNTGVVFKLDTKEVYNDPAATTVTVSAPVEAAPAIGVTKTVSDTDESNKTSNTATAGEAMTYIVSYTNTGAGVARGAFIEDDYDERYIKISDNGGSQDSGSALLWTLGDVAAGQTVTKTFKVTINSDLAEVGATIKNLGTVGAQNQTEKSAEVATTVPPKTTPGDQPYLVTSKIVVNENGGTVDPGDVLRYIVTIENKGKAAATNASLEDTISTHLENLKIITIPTGAKDESTSTKIKITGFTVNAGASVQIVYTANVKMGTANGTKISNDVVVTYGTSGGTTGGRSTGTSTGQVGSAFTGPGTGAAEANALEAGAAKAAATGANPLTTAMVVIGLAIAAGIVAVILRKRSLVS